MYFTSNDGFQNIFVNQPTLNMIKLKKGKDYVIEYEYVKEYVIG